MNVGFSSLAVLKRHLLAVSMQGQNQFDAVITAMGLGVAAAFARYCDRDFGYQAGAVETFRGGRIHYIVRRYPIRALASVEMRLTWAGAWQVQASDFVQDLDEQCGIVQFAYLVDESNCRLRVTYDGGYWWDTTEDGSGVAPSGVPLLPADIQQAWLLQCQEIWNKRDKLGLAATAKADEWVRIERLDLLPIVTQILDPHRRLSLT
jgi:hypothetical protein